MDRYCWYFFSILLLATIAFAGCTSQTASNTTATEGAPVINVTVTATPTPAPLPVYTLSPGCQELADALDDDTAYRDYLNETAIVSRIEALSNNCNVADGSAVNQLILKGPKPGSTSLLENRKYLIFATEFCQAPNSAARTRTQDALKTSETKLAEYSEALDACDDEFSKVIASGSTGSSALTAYSGTGDDVISFTARETGLRIFTMQYSGGNTFSVQLLSEQGDLIAPLVNETGAYSGKHSEKLSPGNYYLDITAIGQWTISIESV